MKAAPRRAKRVTAKKRKTARKRTRKVGGRTLTHAQLAAGFGGKAAQKRAGH